MYNSHYDDFNNLTSQEKIERMYQFSELKTYWVIGTQDGIDSRVLIMFSNDCKTTGLFENNLVISVNFTTCLLYLYTIYFEEDYKNTNYYNSFEVKRKNNDIIKRIYEIRHMISFPNEKKAETTLYNIVNLEQDRIKLSDICISDLCLAYKQYISENQEKLLIMTSQFEDIIRIKYLNNDSGKIFVLNED